MLWESAFASEYDFQISNDSETWVSAASGIETDYAQWVYTTMGGNITGRYVRLFGVERATSFGISIFSFQISCGSTGAFELLRRVQTFSGIDNSGQGGGDAESYLFAR